MLGDLPPEIVSEIASHLPYRDIITLRQVFLREDLRDATNAHAVWLNLATQYLVENPHSHFSNKQSLSSLATDQLRRWFEKRLIVDHTWQVPEKIYPSIGRLRERPCPMITIKIAPGGRWLFAGTGRCSLYYWDLDSDKPEPELLEPCDGDGITLEANNTITGIDFLVECGDPLSGFVIAFIGRDFHGDHKKSGEWLYIWDVIPQESGILKAKHLRTLPLPYHGSTARFSFNDHLAARAVEGRVDVYWWKDCTETHLVRCTLVFKRNLVITNSYVVGSDKLLVFTRYRHNHKARLYALEPEYSDVNEVGKVASHATKIWSFRFGCDYHGSEVSRLFFDGAKYSQIIAAHNGIFRLTIPASQADKPALEKVSDFNLYQQENGGRLYGLGLNKGYCRVGNQLYRFAWGSTRGPYDYGVTLDSRLCDILQDVDNYPAFDEELGRLVSVSRGRLILHDFSLPLYNLADVYPNLGRIKEEDAWTYTKPCIYER